MTSPRLRLAAPLVSVVLLVSAVGCRSSRGPAPAPAGDVLPDVRRQLGLDDLAPLQEAARRAPADPAPRIELAQAQARARDLAGAVLTLYPAARRGAPPRLLADLAGYAGTLGWFEITDEALRPHPNPPPGLLLHLASVYARRGERDRSAGVLKRLHPSLLTATESARGAETLLQIGDPAGAELWAAPGSKAPNGTASRVVLARCLLRRGEAARAAALFTDEDRSAADARFWSARARILAGSPAERERALTELDALAEDPRWGGPAAYAAARERLKAGRAADAVRLLEAARRAGYADLLCQRALAAAYQALNRPFESALSLGRVQFALGRHASAEAAFQRAVRLRPAAPEGWLELCRTLSSEGKATAALAAAERAGRQVPDNVDLALLHAAILGRLERVREQVAQLDKASRLDPKRANEPLGELGKVYYGSQKYPEARAALEQALSVDEGDAFSQMYLGLTLARDTTDPNRASAAVRHLLRAAEASPDYHYPWLSAGSVLLEMRRPEEAAACFRRAISADPRWDGPYLSLSRALAELDRKPERQVVLRLYQRARQLESTRLKLENNASQHPTDPAARTALGKRLLRDGRAAEALPELIVAVSLAPQDGRAAGLLSQAADLLGYEGLVEEVRRARG